MMESNRGRRRGQLLLRLPGSLLGRALTGGARLVGAGLLVAIGAVHLILAPQYYPAAAYIGVLFYVTCAAAWLTAAAVLGGLRGAWLVGALIAAGAFGALVTSATVGLPGFVDSFDAPWAMLSLLIEGLFVAVYVALALVRRTPTLSLRTPE